MRSAIVIPLLLAVAFAPAVPAVEAPASLHDIVLAALAARPGGVPATLTVDTGYGAREVPTHDALALLRTNDAPAPRAESPLVEDVGHGVRTGFNPCYVAAVVTAFRWEDAPALHVTEPVASVPQPDLPCGPGFRTWLGEVHATVPDGVLADACLAYEGPLGFWSNIASQCHLGDFREARLAGRVGTLRLGYCDPTFCITLEQIFGGTINAPGGTDSAIAAIR